MSRGLRWSREALDDLKAQVAVIARDDATAARRVKAAIQEAAAGLARMPTGRPGRLAGAYEKSVIRFPSIVAYALTQRGGEEVVVVLRVIHTAREWPSGSWSEASQS